MDPAPGPRRFFTTRWSVVLAAGRPDSTETRLALSELCEAYWYPLFAWARRRGHSDADAKDLVQGFFSYLLEKSALAVADPERGRFRSFLLTSFTNFLANEHDRASALRRGGGRRVLPLDGVDGEDDRNFEPSHGKTPEWHFYRDWAVTLLERVLDTLRAEYESRNRSELFRALRPVLGGRGDRTNQEIAADLGTSEGALRVALHRLRRRYREELRREIGETVERGEDVEDEIRQLFVALDPAGEASKEGP